MSWMDWIAHKHDLFVHLPFAAALLLPFALVAAQRLGRGIKPWWTTCRYLAWAGVLGSLPAVITGIRAARTQHFLSDGQFIARGAFSGASDFHLHNWMATGALALGLLTLRSLYRKREEHQGIGILGLFLGTLWAITAFVASYYGNQLSHPTEIKEPLIQPQMVLPPTADPEANLPLRALNYQSLIPLHSEPVKSVPHGKRWIRVWANDIAAAPYREGRTLPEGSFLVMSSLEDRWGRPGYEAGPLYTFEMKQGGIPSLGFYWGNVPESRREETKGAERAYWRGDDENLKGCLQCHTGGIAPLKDRSKWGVPRVKPKVGEDGVD